MPRHSLCWLRLLPPHRLGCIHDAGFTATDDIRDEVLPHDHLVLHREEQA
ncbi:Atu4866 domain-containing protein [Streptomyces sioyaensis]